MADEFFKVRHGLTVGDDALSADATTGNLAITGDLTVSGNDIISSTATALTLSGADVEVKGDLRVSGNDIKSGANQTAISMSGNDVLIQGDLTVNGNEIKSSTTAVALTLSGSDVLVSGDLTVTGNDIKSSGGTTAITLSGANVTVAGDLTVSGTTTTLDTQNLLVEDNSILLNKNEAGAGVTAGTAGIEIERGSLANVDLRWNESTDRWQTTVDGSTYINLPNQDLDTTASPSFAGVTGGNVRVGIIGDNEIDTSTGNLTIDSAGGTTTIDDDTVITGDLAVNGADITTTATGTAAIFNTNATTLNVGGAATAVSIGATTGTTEINNNLQVDLDLDVRGGDITTNQTTFNLVNTTATTLNIGGGATTAVNIGNSSGEIITPSDIKVTGNKSIRQGDGPYAGSTDIYRNNVGNVFEGLQVTNASMTSSNSILLSRNYGQTTSGGGTTTAGPGLLALAGTRGTAASPLANNNGNQIAVMTATTNYGDTTGGGTGNGWGNDLYALTAQVSGYQASAVANHRQTLQATFTGSVTGTTLTVTAVTSGTIVPGHELRITNLTSSTAGIVILRQLTSTAAGNALGSTGTYTISQSLGSVASTTLFTYLVASATQTRLWTMPSTIGGTAITATPTTNSPQTLLLTPSNVGGVLTSNFTNLTLQPGWNGYPVASRTITAITGGNTLNIGTHGFTTTGASFIVTQLGNPNGLTTNAVYYIDTIPSSTTITLRTNSVSGGAVTGLTDGTNLFITARTAAQVFTGDRTGSNLTVGGFRFGFDGIGSPAQFDSNRTNDSLGTVFFNGNRDAATLVQRTYIAGRCTEDWTGTNNTGSELLLNTVKTGTGTEYTTQIGASATTFRTDAFNVINTAGTNMVTVDSSGNVIVTGDLRINGGDILNSTGNTTITMATGSSALTTFAGDIRISGNDIQNSAGNNNISLGSSNTTILASSINFSHPTLPGSLYTPSIQPGTASNQSMFQFNSASPAGSLYSTFNFQSVRFDGTNLSPTQVNDVLGEYKFNGNIANSGSSPSVPGAPGANITATANENWTNTANGTDITFSVVKKGAITSVTSLKLASDDIRLRGDQLTLQDSNSLALTSAAVNYTRTYGEFAYTNAAGFDIPAQNTIYTMPLDTTLNNSGVTISGTGNININVSGWYKIIISLQVTLTVSNQPGQLDFWLRKNGADVPNSKTQVDLLKDQKAVIAMDWLVNSDGNDYWEIVYVGTTANYADIDFPTIAATTTPYVSPVAPALIVNVIPAGM